jgi:hypothetical protein
MRHRLATSPSLWDNPTPARGPLPALFLTVSQREHFQIMSLEMEAFNFPEFYSVTDLHRLEHLPQKIYSTYTLCIAPLLRINHKCQQAKK